MNGWKETAKVPPTKEDANQDGLFVLSVYFSESMNKWRILQQYWELVKLLPDEYPFWMQMPELPEMLDRINKGLHA